MTAARPPTCRARRSSTARAPMPRRPTWWPAASSEAATRAEVHRAHGTIPCEGSLTAKAPHAPTGDTARAGPTDIVTQGTVKVTAFAGTKASPGQQAPKGYGRHPSPSVVFTDASRPVRTRPAPGAQQYRAARDISESRDACRSQRIDAPDRP